jgi:hypothetical protein
VKAPSILLHPGPPFNQIISGSLSGFSDLDCASKKYRDDVNNSPS